MALPEPGGRHHRRASRTRAASLEDLLARETFFKELPAIEQHAKAIEAEYARRFDEALDARVAAYTKAFDTLVKTPGWSEIDEDQQRRLAAPFERGQKRDAERVPIPQLRADRDACEGRLRAAVAELRRIIDGERVVTVSSAATSRTASRPRNSSTPRSTAFARSAPPHRRRQEGHRPVGHPHDDLRTHDH